MPRGDTPTPPVRLALLVPALALALAACTTGDGDEEEVAGTGPPLSGAELAVGSKEFTEQLVLGQLTIQALEAAGAEVTDQTGIEGTENVRAALISGEIDLYWDYTGTGWATFLQHEVAEAPGDADELYAAVAEEDLAGNDVRWLAPSAVDNTYALAMSADAAGTLGVTSISDYAALASADPAQGTLCAANEFLDRDDGWPGVERTYGFDLPDDEIAVMTEGIIYTQIGGTCSVGEVFATDGRIVANDLVVLEDDQEFFVKYNLAPTLREDVFSEHPAIEDVLTPIVEALDNDTMLELNARVDVDGELPEDVAASFLEGNGLLS